jgi:actin-related protein
MSTIAEQDVIVLDPGSGYIKAGFAGEDTPRVVIPSVAINLANQAVPTEVSHAFKDLDWVFGYDALDALRLGLEATGKQTLAVIRPIERGVIKDWEAFELLCEHVICVSLGVREPALVRFFFFKSCSSSL